MVVIWKEKFKKNYGWFAILLFLAALARLVILTLPGNDWQSPVSPHDFALYRNIPFWIQGLGAAFLFWKDGKKFGKKLYPKLAWLFLLSFAFYTPVILFAQEIPMLGMLMLPKTLIYGIVANVVYKSLLSETG